MSSRTARYRARLKNNMAVLSVEAPYFELIEALIDARYLTETTALDRNKVEAAVSHVLKAWIALHSTGLDL